MCIWVIRAYLYHVEKRKRILISKPQLHIVFYPYYACHIIHTIILSNSTPQRTHLFFTITSAFPCQGHIGNRLRRLSQSSLYPARDSISSCGMARCSQAKWDIISIVSPMSSLGSLSCGMCFIQFYRGLPLGHSCKLPKPPQLFAFDLEEQTKRFVRKLSFCFTAINW